MNKCEPCAKTNSASHGGKWEYFTNVQLSHHKWSEKEIPHTKNLFFVLQVLNIERYCFVVYRRSIANWSSEANLHINSRNKFISVDYRKKGSLFWKTTAEKTNAQYTTEFWFGLNTQLNLADFPIQLPLIELE